ncbi:hypothetical protein TNCV_2149811 [Trichonephila clavipes]|nr:hypothetical protein TNCV_2149811 [Trichonephila clavipes]
MFDPSSFVNPTPQAHADVSRDVLPRGEQQKSEREKKGRDGKRKKEREMRMKRRREEGERESNAASFPGSAAWRRCSTHSSPIPPPPPSEKGGMKSCTVSHVEILPLGSPVSI